MPIKAVLHCLWKSIQRKPLTRSLGSSQALGNSQRKAYLKYNKSQHGQHEADLVHRRNRDPGDDAAAGERCPGSDLL